MADSICKHDPTFSKRNFVSSVTCNVENLELKQRIEVMQMNYTMLYKKILMKQYIYY